MGFKTRIHNSKVMEFLVNTNFTEMVAVEAACFVRGLWLLWDNNRVIVEPISMGDQAIIVLVKETTVNSLLSIVYASPKAHIRDDLWLPSV